jgi:hypothetical protein
MKALPKYVGFADEPNTRVCMDDILSLEQWPDIILLTVA